MRAELITGNLKENTMTFEVTGEMILKAGNYIIIEENETIPYKKFIVESFIKWYNAKPKSKKKELITIHDVEEFMQEDMFDIK